MVEVVKELQQFIEAAILPCYDRFDAAHQRNHVMKVIEESMVLAHGYEVDSNMVYAIAAYHDLGLIEGRESHHLVSGSIVRGDERLRQWFTPEEIEVMAQAVEDHRASATHAPRSIYGCIVAEADRNIDISDIITRTLQYSLAHYPELDEERHIHYLKLWIPGSKNECELHRLWDLIDDKDTLRGIVTEQLKKVINN